MVRPFKVKWAGVIGTFDGAELELHAATSQLEVITWVLFWTGLDPKVLVVYTLV